MFIFDAHLDLSMNAMEWNRDLRNDVATLRRLEKGMDDKPDREKATVSFPDLRKGNIGIVVATQIARFVKPDSKNSWMELSTTSLGTNSSTSCMVQNHGRRRRNVFYYQ